MNNRNKAALHDNSLINTSENYEVEYWANKFGVRPERLKTAVRAVGNSAAAVAKFLNNK
ncbi:DUF3606 domain-containing protein [Mucilaginibacter rubeus]|uniref:DUF3606 domain-containing protein n=1 Tax=Mucilaginibacter rubeus TaxID=2027860 RepID=UPI001662FE48|nr:DUF3606 domain-containing protein [Mucilaginibacter rubeus]GGA89651.1 DUF3606 domain-containing protein [Mucilaginibacter rubeus]